MSKTTCCVPRHPAFSVTGILTITILLCLANPCRVANGSPYLVKAINDLTVDIQGFKGPRNLTRVGSDLFFSAANEIAGQELWKSDGTMAGSVMVKDLLPGIASSNPRLLTDVDGMLFFCANDETEVPRLWKSDGTPAGTVMIRDVQTGNPLRNTMHLTNVNGTLFFFCNDASVGIGLWIVERGSERARFVDQYPYSPSNMPWIHVNGILYSAAYYEIWKSDGTTTGTLTVCEGLNPGEWMTNVNGTVFFNTDRNAGPMLMGLAKTDGTPEGTVLIKAFNTCYGLCGVNGTLYFNADDGIHGRGIWKSDGTTEGTALVMDIFPGAGGSNPTDLVTLGGKLYLAAEDRDHGRELWQSDGTKAGTVLLQDINPGPEGSYPTELSVISGRIYFAASDGASGYEPWVSNGTAAGTYRVADITHGLLGSNPASFVRSGNLIYFLAGDYVAGRGQELWAIPRFTNSLELWTAYK